MAVKEREREGERENLRAEKIGGGILRVGWLREVCLAFCDSVCASLPLVSVLPTFEIGN